MKYLRLFAVAALLTFGLAVAACDDGDDGNTTGDDITTEDTNNGGPGDDVTQQPGDDLVAENDLEPTGDDVTGTGDDTTEPPVCQDECANVGVKTCTKEGTAVMECQAGPDGCNVMAEIETCAEGQSCSNGECVTGGTGDNDCFDILKCSATCTNQQCVQQCAQTASQDGVNAYNAVMQCAQTSCAQFQNDGAAMNKCLLESCDAQWSGCVGPYGTDTCMTLLQCAQGCGQNADCQFDCIAGGSKDAQVKLWEMQSCLGQNCSQCGNDQQCFQTCAQQNCMDSVMACQQG